ncbi:hypothetical protein F2Q69_00041027 [Brassica cretica]|uniref:Uncharacterized protein n=1 Tax=Brassica cretica TaxID=69181 RepID=A0A8S9NK31_BRACR|nr:hypothetical protein F2Q69_00041027 [Brassica cretica]
MAATKMFFRFGNAGFSDLEDVWDDLPVSRLKYNVMKGRDMGEDFVRQLPGSPETSTTSRKSSRKYSRRLPGSLPDDFQEVFFHIKWSSSSYL